MFLTQLSHACSHPREDRGLSGLAGLFLFPLCSSGLLVSCSLGPPQFPFLKDTFLKQYLPIQLYYFLHHCWIQVGPGMVVSQSKMPSFLLLTCSSAAHRYSCISCSLHCLRFKVLLPQPPKNMGVRLPRAQHSVSAFQPVYAIAQFPKATCAAFGSFVYLECYFGEEALPSSLQQ